MIAPCCIFITVAAASKVTFIINLAQVEMYMMMVVVDPEAAGVSYSLTDTEWDQCE